MDSPPCVFAHPAATEAGVPPCRYLGPRKLKPSLPPESVSGFHAALMSMALAWGGGQGGMGRPPMLSSRGEDRGGSDKGAGA